ncbi:asparagine--tRNA ligase [Rubricoccus marinus]|uniref:Asparagine--tRNA ligase n=1 Tax=Rubricoccus marinus TaxID=716817 RepID=A0A259TZN2_9BACT|nr:asparagine--tRNA ligase [Rubricoccus marinus]OZC03057.1 asparagine--tRNA ligase [Rubricoccus marinus]
MATARIASLADHVGQTVTLQGWLYNQRGSKALAFLEVRDGSGIVQVVVSEEEVSPEAWQAVQDATQESGIEITGEVVEDARQTGGVEVRASGVTLVSQAEPYPITPKEHGVEFLMDRRHLWLRSKRQWAIARVRNRVIMAIHGYFQEDGFIQMDAPILTGNAVEGTSTLFELDYFEEPAYLTQSGQLHGEAMAMAHGKVYTFGPTFRAEKSKTRRHLTEFWMIEPEMAFHDLAMNMEVAEGLLRHITQEVIDTCAEELEILERDVKALRPSLDGPYPRLSYSEAVDLLTSDETQTMLQAELDARTEEKSALDAERDADQAAYGQAKKGEKRRIDSRRIEIDKRLAQVEEDLRNLPKWMESARSFEWGADFGGSDETVITKHFRTPIIVHRYPAVVKAFYMKRDPEDNRLALGMDVLAPEGYGEIIGGGERATDLQFLRDQIALHGLPESAFDWYLDLRRYGSVPHAGFGLGLERTVSWMCGLHHLREAIPFPRLIGRLHP